ncbi:GMC oxidoreductase [Pedobacter nutrimenti]|jgi:choline dehydrogenase-like flavoprotein|uniref:Choline dehydrogenase-like flavoprotein n=1 Tax=Pedobacter nutrimenti TaxID=1241337 RepID=A0A318ULB7_9SPHI|nr:GMC family oxidoreductase [Pedobacter nutrimenti]PYF76873.1 choline dehydrogenase-like flavoprotein [Pedobacter nutrimenti]
MNLKASKENNSYDAIVIGSGISGGWAAMELCKKGLKTLLLERGRDVKHIQDYPTANLNPWDFEFRLQNTQKDILDSPVQSQLFNEGDKLFYVKDKEHPYIQEKPFNWIRGYQVGGRSLTWGRQCYRLSDLDFGANAQDGNGVDWPIRYRDIQAWYDYVESYIGVSGSYERLAHLPDGKFLPAMELNCIERHLAESVKKDPESRILTIARVANLTRGWDGRGPCQNRNLCTRGCPFGGYFSSNSSTIPAAMLTGNLSLRPYSIVSEILYDEQRKKAKGVRVIDAQTKEVYDFFSKIIFVNASTVATASILLNSKSNRFPNGFGNGSEQIGHNLMDHHSSAGASGVHEGFQDKYYKGRRPCGFLIPRYRNLKGQEKMNFLRGYNLQGHGERREWMDTLSLTEGFGADFKKKLSHPGPWTVWMAGWGECLPYYDNKVSLDENKKDEYGVPLVKIDFSFRENEHTMMQDIQETSAEMLKKSGFKDIDVFNYQKPGGTTVHEMGTARMGRSAKDSVLNANNQMHEVKNVFITDGSCMTSSACQNPSLTYMALTARACDFAYNELKKGNL